MGDVDPARPELAKTTLAPPRATPGFVTGRESSTRAPPVRGTAAEAIDALRKKSAEARAMLADPARLAQFQAARQRDQADAKYCWK